MIWVHLCTIMGKITFYTEDISFTLPQKRDFRAWIESVVRSNNKEVGEISYIFCSDAYLLDVNKQYLNHDYYTDIITFDYCEGQVVSGDLFISIQRVKEYASENSIDFQNELQRVVIHGVLHLLGHKDKKKEDAANMRKLEENAMKIFPKKQ